MIHVIMQGFTALAAFTGKDRADEYAELIKRRRDKLGGNPHISVVPVDLDPRHWPEDPAHPLCAACGRRVKAPCNDAAGYHSEGPWDGSCEGVFNPS